LAAIAAFKIEAPYVVLPIDAQGAFPLQMDASVTIGESLASAPRVELGRASSMIATMIAIATLLSRVTALGAERAASNYPRKYAPRTWFDRFKLTWAQIQASAPTASSPMALIFWTTSWLCFTLCVYFATRVTVWTIASVYTHISTAIGLIGSMTGGSAMSSLIATATNTIGRSASSAIGNSATSAIGDGVMREMGKSATSALQDSATGMIADKIRSMAEDGAIPAAIKGIVSPITATVSQAKDATRRDVIACLWWLVPTNICAVAVATTQRSIANREIRSIDLNPIDPMVCAK
jgi:hypothetical protein